MVASLVKRRRGKEDLWAKEDKVVRSYNNTKLQTKPTSPLTHQQPGYLQQSSQFTQGGQEWKQQEGADSKTFFSSLVDISN